MGEEDCFVMMGLQLWWEVRNVIPEFYTRICKRLMTFYFERLCILFMNTYENEVNYRIIQFLT